KNIWQGRPNPTGPFLSGPLTFTLSSPARLASWALRTSERHYAPWVRSRQEQRQADLSNAWKQDPELVELGGVHARDTRNNTHVTASFYSANSGGAGGNRTHA